MTAEGIKEFKFREIADVEVLFDPDLENKLDLLELRPDVSPEKLEEYRSEQKGIMKGFYKFIKYFVNEKVCYP